MLFFYGCSVHGGVLTPFTICTRVSRTDTPVMAYITGFSTNDLAGPSVVN